MKITEKEYKAMLENPQVPGQLKEQLRSQSTIERWSFVGTDFS